MNSTLNDSLAATNDLSIATMKSQVGCYIAWIIFGSLNSLAAFTTIVTIALWKPLHTDTQILAANLAFTEILSGLSFTAAGCYHLMNIAYGLPETQTQKSCYLKVFMHYWSCHSSAFLYLGISIDRFMAAIYPILYKNRNKRYSIYMVLGFLAIPSLISFFSFFDLSDKNIIPVCLARAAISDTFYNIQTYSLMTVSTASFVIYCLNLTILRLQLLLNSFTTGNVAAVRSRLHNKVTRALGFSAALHLVTVTTSSYGTIVLTSLVFRGSLYGPYLAVLLFLGGIISFTFYTICQKQFRSGLRAVLRSIEKKILFDSRTEDTFGLQVLPSSSNTTNRLFQRNETTTKIIENESIAAIKHTLAPLKCKF